jgi:hypothetical protein
LLVIRDSAARENGKKNMAGKRKDKASIETTPDTKRPGVIALIIELLTQAPEPGISVAEMVEHLAKATGRDPAHLTSTVKTQLTRLQRTRGLKIERVRVDGVMRYKAV